jgi:hypothetical protein
MGSTVFNRMGSIAKAAQTHARVIPKRALPDDLRQAIKNADLDADAFEFHETFEGTGIYVIKGEFKTGRNAVSVLVEPLMAGRYRTVVGFDGKDVYVRPFRSLDDAVNALAGVLHIMGAASDHFRK